MEKAVQNIPNKKGKFKMNERKYAEEIRTENNELHDIYVWDREAMKEMIRNMLETDDEEFLEKIATDIDYGEEITIESSYISKFRIATPEHLERAKEYEEKRLCDIEVDNEKVEQFMKSLKKLYDEQF